MIVFMDSSALLKRYIEEHNSDKVELILEKADDIIISPITLIEINSALKRRYFEKDIEKKDYEYLLDILLQENKEYSKIKFDIELEDKAVNLIDKYQIRTLDSIQLASAMLSKCEMFVTADRKLANFARSEGLKTELLD
ncbi:MAG: type II toxin-antitoxin system VapC family toxin [Candidatus Aureabacteria bacterium]|nr:type II toxin-antitoxin system VapC family toxin [Candidatus Auribacterota bacterium]